MRLLNTSTLELEEFFGDDVPDYAILSHRWESEEVTFQDVKAGRGVNMAGYSKIVGCCKQAKADGWQYAWVDSCCIDKTSSAELSEAINSMFMWYREAQVCYAYLGDVPFMDPNESLFGQSKWFSRGWTLQELLAPAIIIFFDQNWNDIGTKSTLRNLITSITGITYLFDFEVASAAQKMSWAARRQTTRVEDQAYCLMGLFGVHMPLLYGEGQNAFLRLQLEILKLSDDESIFAWTTASDRISGLLAPNPSCFVDSGDIIRAEPEGLQRAPYTMTNRGLQMELFASLSSPLFSSQPSLYGRECTIPLKCWRKYDQRAVGRPLAINIRQMGRQDEYARTKTQSLVPLIHSIDAASLAKRVVYFKQHQQVVSQQAHQFFVKVGGESFEQHRTPRILHHGVNSPLDEIATWKLGNADEYCLVLGNPGSRADSRKLQGELFFTERFEDGDPKSLLPEKFAVIFQVTVDRQKTKSGILSSSHQS